MVVKNTKTGTSWYTLTQCPQVLRTDIVMDIGQSINPAIDVEQIEGAFVQVIREKMCFKLVSYF